MCRRIDFRNNTKFIEDMKNYYNDEIKKHNPCKKNLSGNAKELYNLFPNSDRENKLPRLLE